MTDRHRPWSPAELEAKVPEAVDRLHDAVASLRSYGVAAARTEWAYREAMAECQARTEGANKEQRDANAVLMLVGMACPIKGWENLHPGLARDLARNQYADQRSVIAAISEDIGVMKTLMVSARKNEA